MKFLICGLGSIGKRHVENLEKIGIPCENILIYRTGAGTKSFGDEVLTKHNGKHIVFSSLEAALDEKPNVAIISNPTSLHIPVAISAAQQGCHIFLEKPISHSTEGTGELKKITSDNRLKVFVAYQMRFHPLFRQIKKWLNDGKIGRILHTHAEMSERITDWHPWEDYRASYASKKSLGGGVVLTQSHELDMLYCLFGKPKWIFAAGGKLSDLDIDSEDTAKSIMGFANEVIVSLHVDYIKKPPSRFIEITGTNGRIHWDYFKKELNLIFMDGQTETTKEPTTFDRNDMYFEEMKNFLQCVSDNTSPAVGLKNGMDVLEMALATKKSMDYRTIVYLD